MKICIRQCFLICTFASAMLLAQFAAAQSNLKVLSVNGFGGVADWPVWVAQEKGFFSRSGLTVDYEQTHGSKAQFQDMMADKFEIASTLLDNVVGYAEQQGGVKLDPPSDAFVFMGSHFGVNSLVVSADIKQIADLRGHTVAVDAVSTGYAFMLFSILEKNGLLLDRDYKAVEVGSSPGRFAALRDNSAQAALMSAPADIAAKAQGFGILTDTVKTLGPYQAGVYAARRSWAKDHGDEIVKFITAMVAAHQYIFDDKRGAIDILRGKVPSLSEADAEAVYITMTGKGGFDRLARIDDGGVKTALDLRSRYAKPHISLAAPGKYIDLHYYRQATKQ